MKRLFWLVGLWLILQLGVCILLLPQTWILQCIEGEQRLVANALGGEASHWVSQEAVRWYHHWLVDSGWQQAIYHFFIPTEAERSVSVGMQNFAAPWFAWVTGRLEALFALLLQCGFRLAQMKVWGAMVLMLSIPALLDGLLMRSIKKTNFDYTSPVIQHYSLRAFGVLLLSQVIIWLSPIAVSPLVTPVIIMVCCVLLGLSVGNLQKRI